ncbi:hypothetical protein TNCV_379851 [Trichonephila clavipes]|nr:hypothetical protein TNCV_379851 [Trichonephila clavipes]
MDGFCNSTSSFNDPSDLNNALGSEICFRISASGVVNRSGSEMTPRDVFKDLCELYSQVNREMFSLEEKTLSVEQNSFQRTSLVGLALDSATSSGLGEPPALQCRTPSRHHLELQDRRDYTPADRAARHAGWLSCPVLSGGLRRKLSFSPVPLHGRSPPRPHHQSKGPQKVQKTPPKCQFFLRSSPLCHHTKSEKHQTQLHSTQSWSATGLRG